MKITKTFTIEMAHRLPKHKGKCRNVHGHSYEIEIGIQGNIDKDGMVMDYGDIKKNIIKPLYDDLDHAYISCKADDMFDVIQKKGCKVYDMKKWSTAENLVNHIQQRFPQLSYIKVKETANSSAFL